MFWVGVDINLKSRRDIPPVVAKKLKWEIWIWILAFVVEVLFVFVLEILFLVLVKVRVYVFFFFLIAGLLDLFEAGVAPVIPSQGSVGASGDLAPLAHMALLLLGRHGQAGEMQRPVEKEPAQARTLEVHRCPHGAREGRALLSVRRFVLV